MEVALRRERHGDNAGDTSGNEVRDEDIVGPLPRNNGPIARPPAAARVTDQDAEGRQQLLE
eukprot:522388-Lingulodinium_polyedra.AAC.1